MRVTHPLFFMILLGLTGLAQVAPAQDAHYWDNQYGTKGELLGGLVVGSPSDLSATFYNPGWIAIHGDPSLLVTTKAFEVYNIKLTDGLGTGVDPSSTIATTSPGYLAGRFSSSDRDGWQWAYSYLQKVKFDFDASEVLINEISDPDPVAFSGEIFRVSTTNEYWYGCTLSRKLRDNVGLGISPYVAYRSMASRSQISTQGLDAMNNFGQAYDLQSFSFNHARLLMKIGLAVEWEKWSAGIAMTTPGIGLWGSGEIGENQNYSGIDLDRNGVVDDPYLTSNFQDKLSAKWKSPVSVAVGASFQSGKTTVHTTAEWFNGVSEQSIMDPEPYRSQSTGTVFKYESTYNLKSVINIGLAIDHHLRPRFALYGSARTDFTALPDDAPGNLLIADWDLWHTSFGALFQFLDIEFTTGLQYSFGRGSSERFINFNPQEGEAVIGEPAIHDIDYNRLKFMFGFNLPFGETGL